MCIFSVNFDVPDQRRITNSDSSNIRERIMVGRGVELVKEFYVTSHSV